MLKHDYPDASEIRRMIAEGQFHRTLQIEAIPPLVEVRSHQRGPVLILERAAGHLLPTILEVGRLNTPRFLHLASSIARAVADLHGANVIHRGLSPELLLCDENKRKCYILDLSPASRLSRMNREIEKSIPMTGNPGYIAPEQTGRINRSVDHRTDLYSLGIIFYQMLANRHPFVAHAPAEWAHAHIARAAPSIDRKDIPPMLLRIVTKLISKNAEDRYQSALGLIEDLDRCSDELLRKGEITEFTPGEKDVSSLLHMSEKLYGRAHELDILLRAFEASRTGPLQMVLVTGSAGVGKTALIGELQKKIAESKGLFVEGKFEQYERHSPYKAWVAASQKLVERTNADAPTLAARTRERIKENVGGALGVLMESIPALRAWFNTVQEPVELPPAESRNRFTDTFVNFTTAFDQTDRPLVIFLDDVQWADAGSLDLLRSFYSIASDARILIILACRDTDVDTISSFASTLEELKKQKTFRIAKMSPLLREDVNQLIADSLLLSSDRTSALASWVHEQTEGNPLYATQLLHTLHQEGTLYFDQTAARWLWNESRLRELRDNVDLAEFLARKIGGLGKDTREILSVAACLGNRFDFAILRACSGMAEEDVKAGLASALNEGLLLASEALPTASAGPEGFTYQFAHDRVQQVSYQLCSDALREKIHLAAARHIQSKPDGTSTENIFALVDHLNQARSLIKDRAERLEASRLNLKATRAAKANAAWAVALNTSLAAIEFLPSDSWKEDYRLSYSVFREALESEYLNGNYSRAEELFRTLSRQTKDTLELVRIYEQLVILYTNMGRHDEAIDLGLRGLSMIGIKLPRRPGIA
ncbi:MAG TPA: AAA family ATPase, partial [Leptospiraceae bacterium]|nr:AAA family ATPase [Leptospiraceae bacterium]